MTGLELTMARDVIESVILLTSEQKLLDALEGILLTILKTSE